MGTPLPNVFDLSVFDANALEFETSEKGGRAFSEAPSSGMAAISEDSSSSAWPEDSNSSGAGVGGRDEREPAGRTAIRVAL